MRLSGLVVAALVGMAVGAGAYTPPELAAQSVLDRSPNLEDAWTPVGGRLYFHLIHRFERTDPPARKLLSSPTFLVAMGLPAGLSAGVRYASSSLLVPAEPNELEIFGRWVPLDTDRGAPVGVGIQAARNGAAESWDAELSLTHEVRAVRLLAVGRAFSAFAGGEAAAAVGTGIVIDLVRNVALAADVISPVDVADADAAWSVGLQLRIPSSPHSLSLHASNANTTTLQGGSLSAGDTRVGFEFTVPLSVAR